MTARARTVRRWSIAIAIIILPCGSASNTPKPAIPRSAAAIRPFSAVPWIPAVGRAWISAGGTPAKPDLFAITAEGGRVDVMQRQQGDKALLVLVNVVESGPGKNLTVKIEPRNFKPAAAPTPLGAKEPLHAKDGAWSLELKPWETAVLVVDQAK